MPLRCPAERGPQVASSPFRPAVASFEEPEPGTGHVPNVPCGLRRFALWDGRCAAGRHTFVSITWHRTCPGTPGLRRTGPAFRYKDASMAEAPRHIPPALLPTTVVGSYPQPDWLIDREGLSSRLPPRVRALELWRVDPECSSRRRTTRRASRSPTWRAAGRRHRHRRRAAARELLEPLRDRARRSRHRQPGRRDRPHRPREPRPARRRADLAPASGRGARRRVPARELEPHDQDHAARPVHDVPAGPGRLLRRPTPSSRWPTRRRSTTRRAT